MMSKKISDVAPEGYPRMEQKNNIKIPEGYPTIKLASNSNKHEFLELYEDISVAHIDAESSYDPRLLTLFEFFRHVYKRRRELLKGMIPKSTDEILKTLEEILCLGRSKKTMEDRSLKRSLSVGSPRPRSLDGDDDQLKLERFKIHTIVPGAGGGGGGGNGNSDVKSK